MSALVQRWFHYTPVNHLLTTVHNIWLGKSDSCFWSGVGVCTYPLTHSCGWLTWILASVLSRKQSPITPSGTVCKQETSWDYTQCVNISISLLLLGIAPRTNTSFYCVRLTLGLAQKPQTTIMDEAFSQLSYQRCLQSCSVFTLAKCAIHTLYEGTLRK